MTDWDTMRALLAGAPNLHGARCKGRSDLFERTVGEHHMTGQVVHSDGRILTTQTQGEASPTPAPAAPRGIGGVFSGTDFLFEGRKAGTR